MKKTILSTFATLVLMSASAHAAVGEMSFSEQLAMQKQQLRPQAFNFFSDRYAQMQAIDHDAAMSFKQQLDSQKLSLRHQQFNPVSDAYLQVHARAY